MSDAVRPSGTNRFGVDVSTPFGRLALTHLLSTGGDALIALVLAGSLFFSIDPSGARWRIFLYLLFTMAPFALVGPLIGPTMDRFASGRRALLVGSAGGRAVIALLMVPAVASDSLLLFPEAFLMLVLAKSYSVTKAAIVPTLVAGDHELVEANSKLQLLSGLAAFAVGIPGAIILFALSSAALAFVAAAVFAVGTVAAMRVPVAEVEVMTPEEQADERAELRSAGVLAASSGMGTLRWIVGFVTFLLAFALRGQGRDPGLGSVTGRSVGQPGAPLDLDALAPVGAPPVWHFGVVVALTGIGGLVGAAVAPRVRRAVQEEYLLVAALVLATVAGAAGLLLAGLPGQATMAFFVAVAASSGKQAFDAVVQRDAPDADRGRSFARFESRFQVIWVLGAAVPVVIAMSTRLGGAIVVLVGAVAGVFYAISTRAVQRGQTPPRIPDSRRVRDEIRTRRAARRGRDGGGPGGYAGPPVA